MLINLKDGERPIHSQDERYLSPAPADEAVCGQYAPESPYYRCTRAAGHEEISDPRQLPHTHAAHGAYRGGMFAVWQDEGEKGEASHEILSRA